MKLTEGCDVCMATGQAGAGGLPGMVFAGEPQWHHHPAADCNAEQLARARPCTNPDHDNGCKLVPAAGDDHEVLKPCRCNPAWVHPDIAAKRRLGEQQRERQRETATKQAREAIQQEDVDELMPAEVERPALPYKDND